MEQGAKFCLNTGKTATHIFQLIKRACADNALSRSRVSEWYARFRDGRGKLEDDERSGRLTAVQTPNMMEIVQELIETDYRMTLRLTKEELEIIRETIRKIVMENLGKREICFRFVRHCLDEHEGPQTASLSRVHSVCG